MDEADALSDRIALMNHGEVKACGSPVFLKEKFGSGYRVTLTKTSNFDRDAFETLVTRITGRPVNMVTNMAQEMSVGVKTADVGKLPELLNSIETHKDTIGIANYGVSTSTVEDVFLKVGNIDVNENLCVEHELSEGMTKLKRIFLFNLLK